MEWTAGSPSRRLARVPGRDRPQGRGPCQNVAQDGILRHVDPLPRRGSAHAEQFVLTIGYARAISGGSQMEQLFPHCAGLDVHKKTVVACVLGAGADGKL